jgi:hypothetical protein
MYANVHFADTIQCSHLRVDSSLLQDVTTVHKSIACDKGSCRMSHMRQWTIRRLSWIVQPGHIHMGVVARAHALHMRHSSRFCSEHCSAARVSAYREHPPNGASHLLDLCQVDGELDRIRSGARAQVVHARLEPLTGQVGRDDEAGLERDGCEYGEGQPERAWAKDAEAEGKMGAGSTFFQA